MCVGVPMRVIASSLGFAECEGRGRRERVNTMLVGDQPAGTWVLAFLGSAREVLEEEQAAHINAALDALEAALAGETRFDAFFPDLVDRTIEPPVTLAEEKLP